MCEMALVQIRDFTSSDPRGKNTGGRNMLTELDKVVGTISQNRLR